MPEKCKLDQSKLKWTRIKDTLTGEPMYEIKSIEASQIRKDLQQLKATGIESIAVVLAHSYTAPQHELFVGKIAEEIGKRLLKENK